MKGWLVLLTLAMFAGCLALEGARLIHKPFPPHVASNDPETQFKYGSIGAEVNGYPYQIWRELPTIFHDQIPLGWREFGFISESGHNVPIGISVRRIAVDRVGFNCGTCHTSSYAYGGRDQIVLGAPASQLDLQRYLRFLISSSVDPRLTPEAVIASAKAQGRPLSFLDQLVVRYLVFPRLHDAVAALKTDLAWMDRRPDHGPGRTDAGNFWRQRWGLHPENDDLVGAVDFPSVWHQRIRLNGWFHWDGDNSSLEERNLSAALAGGATDWLLDRQAIQAESNWLLDLQPPRFPAPLDLRLVADGASVYRKAGCADCHDSPERVGQVTDVDVVQTDPQRAALFSPTMVKHFQKVGAAYSWRFKHYRSTHGYANMPLDGLWMRAPFLHNGSVPTLADLLSPAKDRPTQFYRGCDVLDPVAVGFKCTGGFLFDTTKTGNGNGGHEFAVDLTAKDKIALIEYLKSR